MTERLVKVFWNLQTSPSWTVASGRTDGHCLPFYLSIRPPICSSIHPSVHTCLIHPCFNPSIHSFISLFVLVLRLCMHPSSTYPFILPYISPSFHSSFHPFNYTSIFNATICHSPICQFTHLCFHLSIIHLSFHSSVLLSHPSSVHYPSIHPSNHSPNISPCIPPSCLNI